MSKLWLISFLLFSPFFSSAQQLNWAKQIAGPYSDYSTSLDIDTENNVYTIGHSSSDIDLDPSLDSVILINQGDIDIFISKLNSDGDYVWSKHFGGPGRIIPGGLGLDPFGHVYTTGSFQDTVDFDPDGNGYELISNGIYIGPPWAPQVTYDIFLSKIDTAGIFVWTKKFEATNTAEASSLVTDLLGNVYVGGHFADTLDCDPSQSVSELIALGERDGFVCKLDSAGNLVWAKNVVSSTQTCKVESITTDSDNNLICTGTFRGLADFDPTLDTIAFESAGTEMFISKYSPLGDLLWVKDFDGDDFDYANAVTVDDSGNIYLTGNFDGTTDLDPGPNVYNVTTVSFAPFVVKLNSDGDFIWARYATGSGGGLYGSQTYSISVDQEQNVYFSGLFDETYDFDPGPDTFALTAAGEFDGFITKLNEDGSFGWAIQFGNSWKDRVECIKVTSSHELYATGFFRGSVDFDPGPNVFNISMQGNGVSDVFILKLGTDILTGVHSVEQISGLIIYPNPTTSNVTLQTETPVSQAWLTELTGRKIMSLQPNSNLWQANLTPLPSGVYLIEALSNEGSRTIGKVVKR